MTICWLCFVFQELCEQVFPEVVNVDSSNIVFNDFVDHKPKENETLAAIAKEDNESLTKSCDKSQDGMNLSEMFIISKLKLSNIATYFCVLIYLIQFSLFKCKSNYEV